MSNDTFLLQDACDHCNLIFEDLSLYSDHDIISLAKGEDLEDSPPWSKLQNIWTNQRLQNPLWTNQNQENSPLDQSETGICPVDQSETEGLSRAPIRNRRSVLWTNQKQGSVLWTNQTQDNSHVDQSETKGQSNGPIRNRRSVLRTNQKQEISSLDQPETWDMTTCPKDQSETWEQSGEQRHHWEVGILSLDQLETTGQLSQDQSELQ